MKDEEKIYYREYLETMADIVSETVDDAITRKRNAEGREEKLFYEGYVAGLVRVVSLMQQHLECYGISELEVLTELLNKEDI